MKEFLKLLKELGIVDMFVEANRMTVELMRVKKDSPEWFPDENAVKTAAKVILANELHKNEKLEDAYAELADDLAMNAIAEEIYKIAKENI